MADDVGSIFTSVSINFAQLQQGAIRAGVTLKDLGVNLKYVGQQAKTAGGGVQGLGASFSRTLGIAVRWFVAYRLIRSTLGGIARAIKDVKALEIEAVFTKPALAGEHFADVLAKVSPLATKWGLDVVQTYRAVLQFSRALGDMYEIDLPHALALTDIAMKTTVVTGQNLNESISNMVGYIRLLGIESTKDIDKFMAILYAAAYRTNEALAEAGKRVQGGALAMDTMTDAVQRMLPSMMRFGLSWEQIAAIASVFITNLDEAGQGIGAYSAKLFEAIKNNQKLLDVYEAVGVQLTRESGELVPALVEGYLKMSDAQRDVAASATKIGIGAHIVATFWEGLIQIQQRANDIKNQTNLLDSKAIEMMETLQKKQDRLAVSMRILAIEAGTTFLPVLKGIVDALRNTIYFTEIVALGVGGIGLSFEKVATKIQKLSLVDRIRLTLGDPSVWTKVLTEGIAKTDFEEIGDLLAQRYNEILDRAAGVVDYEKGAEILKLKNQAALAAAMRGRTKGGVLLVEETKDIMREWTRQVNIATYALGPYASKIAIARVKIQELSEQLKELERIREVQKGDIGEKQLRAWDEAIAKTRYQIEEQRKIIRDVNNELVLSHKYRMMEIAGLDEITVLQEKIRDLEKEKLELQKEGLDVSAKQLELTKLQQEKQEASARIWGDIRDRIETTVSTGIMGLIKGTKTWKDLLSNIGEVVLSEIIKKLVHAVFTGQTLGQVFGFVGAITSVGAYAPSGGILPSGMPYGLAGHKGGMVPKDLIKLPRFQYGGEIPALVRPGEYIVREGPAQKYKGLLEAINAGRDIVTGGGDNYDIHIHAVDPASWYGYLRKNKSSFIGLMNEDVRRGRTSRKIIRRYAR